MINILLILLILLLLLSNSSSITNVNETVLLTVISSSSPSPLTNKDNYGLYKSKILETLSLDNKLRYCIKNEIYCIIGGSNNNNDNNNNNNNNNNKDLYIKLIKSFQQYNNDYDVSGIKDNFYTYSNRFLKIVWIFRLLSIGISRIVYLDEDAFICKTFSLDLIFDTFSYNNSIGLTPDFDMNSHRYNTGVMFIKNTLYTNRLFLDLLEIHQKQQKMNDENLSDQLLLNHNVLYNHYDIKNVSRVLYNSLPTFNEMKPYWNLLGLKEGDEDTDRSHVVHFAGVFGGADPATGVEDPVITLLVLKGVVIKHLNFIKTTFSNEKANQYCIDSKKSITILENMINLLNDCINIVFRSVDNIVAEQHALKCLDNTTIISKNLITEYTKEEFKTGLLIYNPF